MKHSITKEDFRAYFDSGYRIIPVGETPKGYGKRPLIEDYLNIKWDQFDDPYDLVDYWFDHLGDKITGLGLPLGIQNNPRLCCIDIDTNDEEIVDKICKYFHTRFKKRGGKGWTLFFQTDGKNSKNYYKFQCPGNLGIIEVFYDKKQIVMPPSWYKDDVLYQWEDEFCTLLNVSIDELPVLPTEWVEGIGTLIGSPTVKVANLDLPKAHQFKDGMQRTLAINELCGRIFKADQNPDVSRVAAELIDYDAQHFPDNSFFLDPRKAHNKTSSRVVNCMEYLTSMMRTIYNNTGQTIAIEEKIETETITFNKLVPVTEAHIKSDDRIPDFNINLIPEVWREMIVEICESQGTPPQAVFMAMMTGLGACLQGNTVIRPEKDDPFFRRTNLACAMVASSGSKKSDIVRNALYEIKKIDKLLKTINSREDLTKVKDLENRIEMLDKKKKKQPEESEAINEEITKLQDELDANPLKGTEFIYENAPIQRMILDAKRNQKTGLLVVKDEMKQVFSDFKKKGNEDARSFYMKGIDAIDPFTYSTISRGKDHIEKHVISLLTNIQPDVLSVHIKSLYGAWGDNDGFLQRIIFVPFGQPVITKPRALNFKRYTRQYEHFNRAFYSHDIEAMIDPSALEHYNDTLRFNVRLSAAKYGDDPIGSVLAKHEGLLCVIGYLYEFLEHTNKPTVITRESLDKAMELLKYIGECTKHLFNVKDKQQDHDAMVQTANMLCSRHFKSGTTQSEMYQHIRGVFKFPTTFYNALRELELRGYVKLVNNAKSNSLTVHINPEVYTI